MSRTPQSDQIADTACAGSAVVFLGGPDAVAEAQAPGPEASGLREAVAAWMAGAGSSLVVAVDSGLHRAQDLGLAVDVVVGDMDSVDPQALDRAVLAGARIERHPAVKDHTDVALALAWVGEQGIRRVLLVGGQEGRLDHLLAVTFVLAAHEHAELRIEAWLGPARLHVVHGHRALDLTGEAGELVSLFALGGGARGITTTGLLYPLSDEALGHGSTRGASNEMTGPCATVTVNDGTVLVVLPGGRGTHLADGLVDPDQARRPTGAPEPATRAP